MLKLKATKKEIRIRARELYSVGYCGAVELLRGCSPFAYSAGVYGWSCDYYEFDGVILSTGYSPIGKRVDEITKDYEAKARSVAFGGDKWQEKDAKIAAIREEWLQAIRGAK